MSSIRLAPELSAALDAAAAAETDTPSRSELIRRIVTEWLQGRGLLTVVSAPEQEIKDQANRNARRRNDGQARSHAATAAHAEMHGMDATAAEKTARRKALTDEPAVVTRAKAKHSANRTR